MPHNPSSEDSIPKRILSNSVYPNLSLQSLSNSSYFLATKEKWTICINTSLQIHWRVALCWYFIIILSFQRMIVCLLNAIFRWGGGEAYIFRLVSRFQGIPTRLIFVFKTLLLLNFKDFLMRLVSNKSDFAHSYRSQISDFFLGAREFPQTSKFSAYFDVSGNSWVPGEKLLI